MNINFFKANIKKSTDKDYGKSVVCRLKSAV